VVERMSTAIVVESDVNSIWIEALLSARRSRTFSGVFSPRERSGKLSGNSRPFQKIGA
jgi:hypothetical protein